jgi:hypothetical protein
VVEEWNTEKSSFVAQASVMISNPHAMVLPAVCLSSTSLILSPTAPAVLMRSRVLLFTTDNFLIAFKDKARDALHSELSFKAISPSSRYDILDTRARYYKSVHNNSLPDISAKSHP